MILDGFGIETPDFVRWRPLQLEGLAVELLASHRRQKTYETALFHNDPYLLANYGIERHPGPAHDTGPGRRRVHLFLRLVFANPHLAAIHLTTSV